jgi:CelD/BcsL family acetyltransferase involved in cellulose biosynthesis
LGSDIVASDYLDLIIVDGYERQVIASLFAYLDKRKGWDLIELKDIPLTSVNVEILNAAASKWRYALHRSNKEICPYIALPKRWDEYLGGIEKKKRKRLEWYVRRLQREGGFDFSEGLVEDSLEETLRLFTRLHCQRMRTLNRETRFSAEWFLAFHKEVCARFLERGWLTFYRLATKGRTVGMLYCFTYNDCLYFYNSGMDMNWSKLNVGSVLLYFAIRDCIEKGLRRYLFLRGAEGYKYFWTKDEHRAGLIHITGRGFSRIRTALDFYLRSVRRKNVGDLSQKVSLPV